MDRLTYAGIDVCKKEANNTHRRLKRLVSTRDITKPSPYNYCREYSLLYVVTTMTMEELEHWLWATKGVDYTGVFELDDEQKERAGFDLPEEQEEV